MDDPYDPRVWRLHLDEDGDEPVLVAELLLEHPAVFTLRVRGLEPVEQGLRLPEDGDVDLQVDAHALTDAIYVARCLGVLRRRLIAGARTLPATC